MAGAFPTEAFEDVLQANQEFAAEFTDQDLGGVAKRGLAIITCMDSRIDPLRVVGMKSGDAKILRNAGARVTDDVLRTLVLAHYLLGVDRILVMPHTSCRMASATEEEIHQTLTDAAGIDTRSLELRVIPDQQEQLRKDLVRIRALPFLPDSVVVGGAIYDVHTGTLAPVDA